MRREPGRADARQPDTDLHFFDTTQGLAPAGMLPHGTWLGDRPPLLRDYHDDRVGESVPLVAPNRVIPALETLVMN